MYRKLASALLVAGAISTKYAMAVSLGEVTMLSALNEPLNAEIRLSNTADLDASQVLIALANPEEFETAGIERTFFHSDIKFNIELDGNGGGVVKLKSERRLNEPFLDILLEAKWPTGKMLRSYTVLVDLPVYDKPQTPAPATAIQTVAPASAAEQRPIVSATAQTVSEAQSAAPVAANTYASPVSGANAVTQDGEYRTQRNDTLWGIASQLAPADDISVQQTMLAIQQLNPGAFFNGNINRLKAGVVLRLPTADVIRDISAQSAVQGVARQNQQWQDAQLDNSSGLDAVRQQPLERQGHLRLTSSGAGMAAGQNEDGSVAGGIQQQLIAAHDELEAVKLEKNELNTRLDSLNSQVEQLQRLVELKNAELASLQQQLGQDGAKPAAAEKPAAKAAPSETAVTQTAETVKAAETKPKAAAQDAKVVKEAAKPKADNKPKQAPATPEPGFVDKILLNPLYIGIVGLLIALGVGGFLLRRRAQAEKQLQEENEHFLFDGIDYQEATDDDQNAVDVDTYAEASADELVDVADEVVEPDSEAVQQTGDAIGEADIYIAYGRYEQAVSLLKSAIAASPNDAALRVKLLEVYLETGDKDGFQQAFVELQARGEHDAVAEAKELLSSKDMADWLYDLPENVDELSEAEDGFSSESDDFSLDADLDLDLSQTEDSSFASTVDDDFLADLEQDDGFLLDMDEADTSGDETADAPADTDLDLDDTFALDDLEPQDAFESAVDMADDLAVDLEQSFEADELALDDVTSAEAVGSDEAFDLADDELSLDLSSLDETQFDEIEHAEESAVAEEEILEFDDLDFSASDEALSEPVSDMAEVPEMAELEDGLALDDLDFSAQEDVAVVEEADEEPELSLDDFDLDFDDIEPEAEAALVSEEPVADVNMMEESIVDDVVIDAPVEEVTASFDNSVSSVDALSSTEFAPQAGSEPYISAPLESLEDDDLSFIGSSDEVATKLDLAQAYIDMGDVDGAREILLEVVKEGREDQRTEANTLLGTLD